MVIILMESNSLLQAVFEARNSLCLAPSKASRGALFEATLNFFKGVKQCDCLDGNFLLSLESPVIDAAIEIAAEKEDPDEVDIWVNEITNSIGLMDQDEAFEWLIKNVKIHDLCVSVFDEFGSDQKSAPTIGLYPINRDLVKDSATLYSSELTDALRNIMGAQIVSMAHFVVQAFPHMSDESVHGNMVKEVEKWGKVFAADNVSHSIASKTGFAIGPDALAFAVEFSGGNLVYFQASEWFHMCCEKSVEAQH